MKEGLYLIEFRGAPHLGSGALLFETGMVIGADSEGGLIDGTYSPNPTTRGMLDIEITYKATRDVGLVDDATIATGASFPIKATIAGTLYQAHHFTVTTPFGSVNVRITKIREFT